MNFFSNSLTISHKPIQPKLQATIDANRQVIIDAEAAVEKLQQSHAQIQAMSGTQIDVESGVASTALLNCTDSWSQQLCDAQSEDAAISDVIYQLDQSVASHELDFAVYQRTIRQLARQQFMARASANRIRSAIENRDQQIATASSALSALDGPPPLLPRPASLKITASAIAAAQPQMSSSSGVAAAISAPIPPRPQPRPQAAQPLLI